MIKLIVPVEEAARIRLSPHRYGQAGYLIIIESESVRIDLHMPYADLNEQLAPIAKRIAAGSAWRDDPDEEEAS